MKRIAILLFVCWASYAQYVPPAGSGGGGGGSGTVTSVAVTGPSYFSIAGSPITTSGTFAITAATGQTTARFLATCNGATSIALCAPAAADLPNLPESQITGLVSDLAAKAAATAATTVNGQPCALSSPCTVTAAPSGSAGGALSGTYPNPGIAVPGSTGDVLINSAGALGAGALISNSTTLAPPAAPTITNQGTPGTTSATYEVIASNVIGPSLPSATTTTTTAHLTPDGTNFPRLTWSAVDGANKYYIIRTTSGFTPQDGFLGVTTTCVAGVCTFDDTGLAGADSPYWLCCFPYVSGGVSRSVGSGGYANKFLAFTYSGEDSLIGTFGDPLESYDQTVFNRANATTSRYLFGQVSTGVAKTATVYILSQGSASYITGAWSDSLNAGDGGANSFFGRAGHYGSHNDAGVVNVYDGQVAVYGAGTLGGGSVYHATDAALLGSGTLTGPQAGFRVDDLTAGTANYAFCSDVSAGANKWAFYGSGTAASHFGGPIDIVQHTPASSTEACTAGQYASDADFVYSCTTTNNWKRTALSTWP